jgi:hypothetical protein
MRRKIYTRLNSDTTLMTTLVGGLFTPQKITTPLPATPFAVIREAEWLPQEVSIDTDAFQVLTEVYVYDRKRKAAGTVIVSYLDIDTAIRRIQYLLHRYTLDLTSLGWGGGHTLLDFVSSDLFDEGWDCIFKFARFSTFVTRAN